MKQIALIGSNGFVGSTLYKALQKQQNYKIHAVTRKNYLQKKKLQFDIVINSAMPSARFWALNNPYEDFIETVEKTADIVYGWNYKKMIHISTISARSEKESIYGKHKSLAETLCENGDNLIVRLTATYADSLDKGALIDIIKGNKVYVDGKSRYSFASLDFVCNWIAQNLDKNGIREVGAKNSLSLQEIASYFHLPVVFEGRIDTQEVQEPLPEFPDAKEVFAFLQKKLEKKRVF